jgi:hypothetical protein
MPTFDEMLSAVRDDCDTVHLAGSADLRRIGARRTAAYRMIGGTAALAVVGAAVAGVALLGPNPAGHGPAANLTAGSPAVAPNTQQTTAQRAAATSPPSMWSSGRTPATTTGSSPGSATQAATYPGDCAAADFAVSHAQIAHDDAAGIQGYDITFRYTGSATCHLVGNPLLSYLDGSGHRITMPVTRPGSGITVHPHATVGFSAYNTTGAAVNPTPPQCKQPHTYAHLQVTIDGTAAALPGTLTFTCSGPGTNGWATF